MAQSNWVLQVAEIGIGDHDPDEYGPYSRSAAEELADWFNEHLGGARDDGSDFFATANPLRKTSKTRLRENYGQ